MRYLISRYLKALIFIFAFLLPGQIFAASFDCAKASTEVEKIVCSDDQLSALDSELGNLFNSLKAKKLNVSAEQKQWLRDQRNVCKNRECLTSAYEKRIESLKTADACAIDKNALMASWVIVKGEAFEEMKLSVVDGVQVFVSWLHHRPEMVGTWSFDRCVLHIKHRDQEKLQFDFQVRKLAKNKLYLFDMDGGSEIIYKKVASVQ